MLVIRFFQVIALLTVLGAFSAVRANTDIQSLSAEQLDAAVNASIVQRKSSIFRGTVDASVFVNLAETVATRGSVDQKAQVFNTAGKRVDSVAHASRFLAPVSGTKQAAADITNGLIRILSSDTNGIVHELSYNKRFNDGRAFTNFIEQLMRSGLTHELASIQTQLLLGNTGSGDHIDRYNQIVDGVAANAGKIGYFSGVVLNAIGNVDVSAKQKQVLVKTMVSTTSSILSGFVGLAYPTADFEIGFGAEAARVNVDQILSMPHASIGDLIVGSAMPFDSVTGNEIGSSAAFVEFQGARSRVESANRSVGN